MITIYLREHSTHNNGYSLDKRFDLNDYTNSKEILNELFAYTKEKITELDSDLDYYNFEEWLITDYEFEDNSLHFTIGEYDSIDKLLSINESLNDLSNDDKIKYIALLEQGYSHDQTLEKFDDCIIYEVENSYSAMSDLAYDFIENGFFGEVSESIKMYLDYDKIGRDLEINGDFILVEYLDSCYLVEICC